MTLKGHGKFRGKLSPGLQLSLVKILPISLNCTRKVKISNLIGLKGTLFQPTTVSGASSCDTEGPWRVWAKTDNWFPIQLAKINGKLAPRLFCLVPLHSLSLHKS